jgi:hypothetical protein
MMDRETYFFGRDMVDNGFADEIISTGADDDREAQALGARLAFENCLAKISGDKQKAKDDMERAALMLAANQPGATAHQARPVSHGGSRMDLATLKKDHPELVAALVAEAVAGMISTETMEQKIAEAKSIGKEQEIARRKAVQAQAIPGHEKLIASLADDGKTTGPEAAMAIVAAEKTLRDGMLRNLDTEANNPVPPSSDADNAAGKTMKRADFDKLDHKRRAEALNSGVVIID